MAYTGNTLIGVAKKSDGSTPAIWVYTSTDDAVAVAAAGYFSNASNVGVSVGDLIIVQDTDNNRAPTLHVVASISSGSATAPKADSIPGLTATATELNKLDGAGAVVASGTQASKITDASTSHSLNATFSDTEVEAALNALGTKINTVVDALEAFGISASS